METDKVVISGVSDDKGMEVERQAKSPLNKIFQVIIGTFQFILRTVLSAIESVVNAFAAVLTKLDFKSKLAFFFIIILIIAITFIVGFNMGQSDKEKEFRDEFGLSGDKFDALKDFLRTNNAPE